MDNYQIADTFSLLSKLMDIHGENSFKSKSYSSAAFTIEKLPEQLSEMAKENVASVKGIGASSAQKIIELLETGELKSLQDIIFSTPPGVVEMLNIKGIGPKKIHTIWKEMEIESVGELLYACKENRLKLYKGFGEKTQQNVSDIIEFYLKNKGSHLYASIENIVPEIEQVLVNSFVGKRVLLTGNFKRQMPTIDELEFVIEADEETIEKTMLDIEGFSLKERKENSIIYNNSSGLNVRLYGVSTNELMRTYIATSSSPEFTEAFLKEINIGEMVDEAGCFSSAGLPFIPSPVRENAEIISLLRTGIMPDVIQFSDIKGIIHCHSNWSDGSNTLEEMARAAMSRGLEYLVISDHSKSAFYAQGLPEEKIREQHLHIDELNKKLHPFKIFKSIESDILNDGNLDYSNEVLASFDLVIASVHSNLKMSKEKAMMRLMNAIENPYTTILGHMTGRLLLSREGYPVDHELIIDACADNNVVIELNASPSRLDMDWKYIDYAMKKNVLISIDPDAHSTDALDYNRYGVLVAQKALLPKERNLSSFSLKEFEEYVSERKGKI